MAHTSRNIVLGLIGAAVVGGLIYVTVRPEPVPVDLHQVARQDFQITVDVDGVTRVADVFEVSAPISGSTRRTPVEVGDPVDEGKTVLALVEPASPALLDTRTRLQAEAGVREAEANLNVAQTDMTRATEDQSYANSQYNRVEQLVERGVASITQLEDAHQQLAIADAALDAAEARITQAESGLQRAEAALVQVSSDTTETTCCVQITSPATGVVLEIDVVSARTVTAGTTLLSVGDPANIELVADLLSSDAVRLPDGARAEVERWGGPTLEAQLLRIEPAARTEVSALGIEEQRVDAVFEILSPLEDRESLGHGFAVFLRIVEYEENDALVVPLSSAFRFDDGWAVFRATGDLVERVQVELGERNTRFAVVLSGLEPGDLVVEHPSEDLDDGALIVERQAY